MNISSSSIKLNWRMDINKFELILKKINTLKQNIELSGEDISELEVELLKNYIKKLYESIADKDFDESTPVIQQVEEKVVEEKVVEEVIIEETVTEQETSEVSQEIEVDESPSSNGESAVRTNDEDIAALFVSSTASELSEKLSAMPINDMKKAMGINERIFTINEMFGGDRDLFNDTMDKLNSFSSFDEAKDFLLEHVARKYEWNRPENHKKVKQFIKLVQRRYA